MSRPIGTVSYPAILELVRILDDHHWVVSLGQDVQGHPIRLVVPIPAEAPSITPGTWMYATLTLQQTLTDSGALTATATLSDVCPYDRFAFRAASDSGSAPDWRGGADYGTAPSS